MVAHLRNYKAWLDEDGKHVWFMHDCLRGKETSMLPYPIWKASDDEKSVTPSVSCSVCGFHETVRLERRKVRP